MIYGRILQFQSICCVQHFFFVLAAASFNLLSCLWLIIIQPYEGRQLTACKEFVEWKTKRIALLMTTHVSVTFVLIILVVSSQLHLFLWNNYFSRDLSRTFYVHLFHPPHVSPKVHWTRDNNFESHFYVIFSICVTSYLVMLHCLSQKTVRMLSEWYMGC
jgi:hypothetical protein